MQVKSAAHQQQNHRLLCLRLVWCWQRKQFRPYVSEITFNGSISIEVSWGDLPGYNFLFTIIKRTLHSRCFFGGPFNDCKILNKEALEGANVSGFALSVLKDATGELSQMQNVKKKSRRLNKYLLNLISKEMLLKIQLINYQI